MARKATDLLADLDELGIEEQAQQSTAPKPTAKASTAKPLPANSSDTAGDNPFDDIEKTLAAKPASASRPTTPRLSSSTTSGGTNKSPKRAEHTPASSGPPSGRNSEDRLRNAAPAAARTSGEGRSYHLGSTPGEKTEQAEAPKAEQVSGGGWWGSVFSAASAAVKQAETLAKEIQGNEEAKKWMEGVKGYGVNLQSLSTDLRTRALPTFTTLLTHIAPPISAHERLQIHTTHDIQNYPSLDPLIYSTFSRVMSQVEGGDLLVIQRGSEQRSRSSSEPPAGYKGSVLGGGRSGWSDGPWWRDEGGKRDVGAVEELREGTRLARVSAEAYAREFFDAVGGVEAAAKKAAESLSETNPVRSSDIFLAIQAIKYPVDPALFAADARAAQPSNNENDDANAAQITSPSTTPEEEDQLTFALHLHDPLHTLSFSTLSQPIPFQWTAWLDASNTASEADGGLPASIREILDGGGVDPREWVSEWVEEAIGLAVGNVAQRYVARRMGVGELVGRERRGEEEDVGVEVAARGL